MKTREELAHETVKQIWGHRLDHGFTRDEMELAYCAGEGSRDDEVKAKDARIKELTKCLEKIFAGVTGMFGAPGIDPHKEAFELIPVWIEQAIEGASREKEEDWSKV